MAELTFVHLLEMLPINIDMFREKPTWLLRIVQNIYFNNFHNKVEVVAHLSNRKCMLSFVLDPSGGEMWK